MHTARLELAARLRVTADRLRRGAPYRWTHQGRCNCGHLAQTITRLSGAAIHAAAVQSPGEWVDHAERYCPTSGAPIDQLIRQMLEAGLDLDEIAALERLAHPGVLRHLPDDRRALDNRDRDDVVLYLETWAAVLDAEAATHRALMLGRSAPALYINRRAYVHRETLEHLELALDENPAAGRAA